MQAQMQNMDSINQNNFMNNTQMAATPDSQML